VLVFVAVLGANAAISYGYTKDEVMSTAGVFYAVAVFAAVRAVLARVGSVKSAVAVAALAAVLGAGSVAWGIRSAGVHDFLVLAGYYARDEWVAVDTWLREQSAEPASEEGQRLVRSLRAAAIEQPLIHPYFLPRWAERWFDVQ
jgi:hypothetical protein